MPERVDRLKRLLSPPASLTLDIGVIHCAVDALVREKGTVVETIEIIWWLLQLPRYYKQVTVFVNGIPGGAYQESSRNLLPVYLPRREDELGR